VEDLDGQVLALLAEYLLLLLLENLTRAVVRVDDVVAQLELDVLDFALDLLDLDDFGNGPSLLRFVFRSAGIGPRG